MEEDELPESEETGWKLYGPYLRKDGRKHVCLIKNAQDGSIAIRRTISYPKYLIEQHLGRKLKNDETVDHQDRDHTNDAIGNLVIRKLSEHAALDAKRVKVEPVACVFCGCIFNPTRDQYTLRSLKKAGPFCSRKCKGKYGKNVQLTGKTVERKIVPVTYYQLSKHDRGVLVEDKMKNKGYIFGTFQDALDYTKEAPGEINNSKNFVYTLLSH